MSSAPVAGVKGLSDLLLSGVHGALTEAQAGLIEKARGASDHLLALIDDLSDLVRIEAGGANLEPAVIRVEEMVEQAVTLVYPLADEALHSIVVTVEPGLSTVVGDPRRVIQIRVNLLTNAIKFTPGPGKIDVEMSHENGCVSVSVRDSGVGIPQERLDDVFGRYAQLAPKHNGARRGSGLRLALSRELAHLHGGDITLQSTHGEGSTFTLTLPAAAVEEVPE